MEADFLGDDVVFCAAVNRADGDDRRFARRDLAAHDGLQREDRLRREHDRIACRLRERAVPADAADRDVHRINIRERKALDVTDGARGLIRAHVQREAKIRLRKTREQAVREHRLRAAATLLRGLTDQHQRALPPVLERMQHAPRPGERGHVDVVPARVHRVDLIALGVRDAGLTGVRQARHFLHRQPIEIRAKQQRGAGTILEHRDEAVTTDARRDFVTGLAQFRGESRGGFLLAKRQLGARVKLLVQFK